jgi:hypothetical protein
LASTGQAEATMVGLRSFDQQQGAPMADPETPSTAQGPVTISSSSAERAPIIYFDGASCFGHHNGAIQIELAANLLMPVGAAVRVDVVQTAHLRCSVAAALALREALDKALAMYKQGQQQPNEEIPAVKN